MISTVLQVSTASTDVAKEILYTSRLEEKEGQLPISGHLDTFEFWDLYMEVKLSRNNPGLKMNQEPTSDAVKSYQIRNPGKQKKSLNKFANVLSGTAILIALANNHELDCVLTWEYKLGSDQLVDFNTKMAMLITKADGLENIPNFLVKEIDNLTPKEFYHKYTYLMGTTLNVRLNNGTNEGYYFCVPFRALKITYLQNFLQNCKIDVPNYNHNMQDWSTRYTFEELESKVSVYMESAYNILEFDALPNVQK